MGYGATVRILRVDLARMHCHTEQLDEDVYRLYPGGKALAGYFMLAMRQKRWTDARRLIVREEELPPELRPLAARFVDAVANPAMRPKLIAEMRAVDPKIAKQSDFVHPYLQLGQVDLVYGILLGALDEQPSQWKEKWDLTLAWAPDGEAFRRDRRFAELSARIGMLDYWKQYGYPAGCRAGEDTAIVCS